MEKNTKKINQALKFVNQIQNIRSKNNKNWMDLLRLSYESNPNKTLNILSKIISKDQSLVRLAKQLKKTKIK